MDSIIPILLLLPIVGAVITLLAARAGPKAAGPTALLCSLAPLGVVIYMVVNYPNLGHTGVINPQDGAWHYNFDYQWLTNLGVRLSFGVDTIGLWLMVLTAVLTPISILASFNYIKDRQAEFYAWMLMLHTGMLGVFAAKDILLFYLFFEFTLIPMFFIIGIWGGSDRRRAAGKFFLFTFAGSVLTLVAIIYLAYVYANGYKDGMVELVKGAGHFSFQLGDLQAVGAKLPGSVQTVLFFGLMAGFAVKVPLFPVHTWLPLAHTEAPTAGSVILAGVLLKLGTYGLLRFALPILPLATQQWAPYIAIVCIVGIIYGALVSWAQGDMKKLIAYSSVSHLAFCVLGMFALTREGLTGSILYMLNHGLSTGALFLVVGMIYERYHTRDMNAIGGLARRVPALAFFAIFFVLSSVALPGLNGFISEFLVLVGTYTSGMRAMGNPNGYGNLGPAFAIPAATGVILSAVYMLYWAGRVIFGPLKEPSGGAGHDGHGGHEAVKDLSVREWLVLAPVAILVLYMGVYPRLVMDSLSKPVEEYAAAMSISAPAKGVAEMTPIAPVADEILPAPVAAESGESGPPPRVGQ